jgi:hypothetical protein
MNERIQELKTQAWDYACSHIPPNALGQKNHEDYFAEKFAELIVRELVSTMSVEGSDFYYNEPNKYGCVTVQFFVPGDARLMRGEEIQGQFRDGVRGTGRFKLTERFVEHLMNRHFGDEE